MIKKIFLISFFISIFLISGCNSEKKMTLNEIGIDMNKKEIEKCIQKYKIDFENKDQDVKLMFVKKLTFENEVVYYLAYIDENLPNPAGETFNNVIVRKSDLENHKISKNFSEDIPKKEVNKVNEKVEYSYYE